MTQLEAELKLENSMDKSQVQETLKRMLEADLQKRQELIERGELFEGYHPEMEAIHAANTKRLEEIISDFGFPTLRRVGEEAAEAAWLVVMHSVGNPPFMRNVLALLKGSQYEGEIEPRQLAYLEDRIRVLSGQTQIYGTQFDWDENGVLSPAPLAYPEQVDELRRSIGLPSLAEQTERMRERVRQEGDTPPTDPLAWKQKSEEWAKKVGWL